MNYKQKHQNQNIDSKNRLCCLFPFFKVNMLVSYVSAHAIIRTFYHLNRISIRYSACPPSKWELPYSFETQVFSFTKVPYGWIERAILYVINEEFFLFILIKWMLWNYFAAWASLSHFLYQYVDEFSSHVVLAGRTNEHLVTNRINFMSMWLSVRCILFIVI